MKWQRVWRFMIACILMASAFTVQAASDECEIDEIMRETRVQMDKMAVGIYANGVRKPVESAIESAPTVKDASCLPVLDTLDMLMRMRIPSIGGALGGLMTKVKNMACNMANSYLEGLTNSVQIGYSDPLGIASVGIGGTTGSDGGMKVDEYDLGEVVEDAAMGTVGSAVGGAVRGNASELRKNLPTGPVDRAPRIENTVRQEVNGAINGL